MRTFIKVHRKSVILNIVIVCVCYIHMAFSMNMGIDTEDMINQEGYIFDAWEGIGRQGLVLTRKLLGLTPYNPYFEGVIFLAAFSGLGILTAFFCWLSAGKNDIYPYGLFLVLFSTCPVWMEQFYFALQRAEVVLALIFTVISILCYNQFVFYKKRNPCLFFVYLVTGVWSFCSYQGCVAFYIGLCVIFVLMDFTGHYREKMWQDYGKMILKLTGGFLLIFVTNTVITRLFFGGGQYLQEQIGWGSLGVFEVVCRIGYHAAHTLFCLKTEYFSVYPLACICLVGVFIGFCRKKDVKKPVKVLLFLILAGLLLTPFLLTICMGNVPVSRSQFALQLISAFALMFACGIWRMKGREKKKYQIMRRGVAAVSIAAVWCCLGAVFRLQYTDDLRYREDLRVAETIEQDLRHTKGAEGLPVIFVGGYTSRLNNGASRGTCTLCSLLTRYTSVLDDVPHRKEVYGSSFLGWDYKPENPTGAARRIVGFMKTMGMEVEGAYDKTQEALLVSQGMESYPAQGYISVQEGFVVVKISEPAQDTDR